MFGALSVAKPAARGAERRDVVEQPVLGVRWQVAEQAFGTPRRRLARVEAGRPQREGPVEAQVDRHGAAVGAGLGADIGQRLGLELDHLRLVHLVHDGAGRPLQAVGAGIQARRQDHHLPDTRGRRVDEEVVEELGPDRHVVDHPIHAGGRVVVEVGGRQLAGDEPGEHVDANGTHQRLGVRVTNQSSIDAGRHRAGGCHHRGGSSHAGSQIPCVVISAHHQLPLSINPRPDT